MCICMNEVTTSFCRCIPVLIILGVVGWSYYAFTYNLCIKLIDDLTLKIVYLVLYHIGFIMFTWSYIGAVITRPAKIPDRYYITVSIGEKLLATNTNEDYRRILNQFAEDLPIFTFTDQNSVRYCTRCYIIKPDRAHHCSACRVCVPKMDHHCPWINNCVSFTNYKYFVLMLMYGMCFCIDVALSTFPFFIEYCEVDKAMLVTNEERFSVIFLFIIAVMFFISLVSLFGFHAYLICKNRTTLESFRPTHFHDSSDRNGFNLGVAENFCQVFGRNCLLWFIPVFTSLGDGYTFPVRSEHQIRRGNRHNSSHGNDKEYVLSTTTFK